MRSFPDDLVQAQQEWSATYHRLADGPEDFGGSDDFDDSEGFGGPGTCRFSTRVSSARTASR